MTDTLVIDPDGINLIVPCQRAGKAEKRRVGGRSYSYSGAERSHIRKELDVIPLVFVNCTPADARAIEAAFALGAQVVTAGSCWNRDDAGTTEVLASGDYTDDMEQGGGWRVPGITLYEIDATGGGLGGFPLSVSPDDEVPTSDLLMWYDAQALVGLSDGDPLLLWPDESGNGNDAPAGNTSFPGFYRTNVMNGFPAIRFDALGNNQRGYGFPVGPGTEEGEGWIVMRKGSTGAGHFWGMGINTGGPDVPLLSSGTFYDHFGSSVQRSFTPLGIDPQEPFLYHARAKAGRWQCWVNGVPRIDSPTNSLNWNGGHFGMMLGSGAFYTEYIGWIGELKIRSPTLSDADGAAEDAALMAKWDI